MASFTAQPTISAFHGVLNESEGGTLLYTFENTITTNANAPSYTVDYWVNGVLFRSKDYDFAELTIDGSDYDYTLNIDASDIVESFFLSTNVLFQSGITTNVNYKAALQLKIYIWTPDANGKLTKESTSVDSTVCDVLPSHVVDLSDYNQGLGRKFLTNEPIQTITYSTLNKYIALYTDSTYTTHLRVQTYDIDNALVETSIIDLSSSDEITIISLKSSDLENYTNILSTSLDIENCKYFIISAGTYITDTYTQYTETRTYHVFDYHELQRTKELHFINKFGFQDTHFLNGEMWTESKATTYETYQKRNVGRIITGGTETGAVSVELRNLNNEDFEWLQDLRLSSRFYIDNEQFYTQGIKGVTKDANNSNNITLGLEKSKTIKTHRN